MNYGIPTKKSQQEKSSQKIDKIVRPKEKEKEKRL